MKVAITINILAIDTYDLRNQKQVKTFLEGMDAIVYVIATERTETSKNIHYHVLAEIENNEAMARYWAKKIYIEPLNNELSYFNYIKKDGNFKIYNDYVPPFQEIKKNEYEALMNDILNTDITLQEIAIKYPKLLFKHFNNIKAMFFTREIK